MLLKNVCFRTILGRLFLLLLTGCGTDGFYALRTEPTPESPVQGSVKSEVIKPVILLSALGAGCYSRAPTIEIEFVKGLEPEQGAVLLVRQHDGALVVPELVRINSDRKVYRIDLSSPEASDFVFGHSLESGKWDLFIDYKKTIGISFDRNARIEKLATIKQLLGDGNGDCFVDLVDLRAFRQEMGICELEENNYDFNGDSCVDLLDFAVIRKHFGMSINDFTVALIPPVPTAPSPSPGTPVAKIISSARSGRAPLIVDFIDQSSPTATKWHWHFGVSDKSGSTDRNPTYIFTREGNYQVTLVPENENGLGKPHSIEIHVGEPLSTPVSNFKVVPTSHWNHSLKVQFVNTSTSAVRSLWDFGDGTTSVEESPVHLYASPGVYTVGLTVSNYLGERTLVQENVIEVADRVTLQSATEEDLFKFIEGRQCPQECELFTSYQPEQSTYVRNDQLWTRPWVDLSGLVVWNSDTNGMGKGGVAVSKLHIVTADHWKMSVGAEVHFLDKEGNTVVRRIVDQFRFGESDANLQVLDQKLPDTIEPVSLISHDVLRSLYRAESEPPLRAIHTNQNRRITPIDIVSTGPNIQLAYPTHSAIASYSIPVVSGDSGSPIFIVYQGRPILVSTFFSPLTGPSYFSLFLELVERINNFGVAPRVLTLDDFVGLPRWE